MSVCPVPYSGKPAVSSQRLVSDALSGEGKRKSHPPDCQNQN